ncbi:ABC transporter permease [Kocuria carniphila]|uniref:ABC transporter permease n=1 Tax=Kocuria carniphila TaxID=262208 RepID=A0ABV3V599_9MICC|nr:ABC transporter permease [Kocuria carniphila]MCT1803178.1 ABC transporter permease [Kocuria carniphila]
MTRARFRTVPGWVLVPALIGALFVLLPLLGMLLRVDWPNLWSLLTSESSLTALGLSLRTALMSTVLCVVLGCPLALVLARVQVPGLRILRSLVLLPLVLPPVVGGIALLYTFGRLGLVGQQLEALGISIAFSTTAVVLAQTFVALPFLVVSLEGALRTMGTRYEEVAAGLGASPTVAMRRITIPLVTPALASGAALSFARCLGEFGATLTFAGSMQGVTRTLPLEIYLQRETDPDAAIALSLLLVLVAVAVVGFSAPARRRRGVGFRAGLSGWLRGAGRSEQGSADADGVNASPVTGPGDAVDRGRGEPFSAGLQPGPGDLRGLEVNPVAEQNSVADQRKETWLDVHVVVAERAVIAEFRADRGQTVALVGPNGVGKSTVFAVIAGLLAPDRGRVRVAGSDVVDLDTKGHGTWRPAHRRGVALMAQEPLLFPHLSVLENVAFGPRCKGLGREASRRAARRWLDETGAGRFADRYPEQLSGGQAQRVAIARVLAAEPELVLLDEPLSALDVSARPEIRSVLKRVLADRTAVIITHDPDDVAELADRSVRLVPVRGRAG